MADTLPALKRKLWDLVSEYVRSSHATTSGAVQCFTCKKWARWQDMDAGHYIPRRYLAVCFDRRNIRPQCRACNRAQSGRPEVFRERLISEIGIRQVDDLEVSKHSTVKFSRDWYQREIKSYKQKIKELED